MRGGERCLEEFFILFPDADLYTLLHCPNTVSPIIENRSIQTSFIQNLPFSNKKYRYYLPFFPAAIAAFDFTGYDLIISSSHCVAKGIHVPKGVCHVAYIHTPMRYIWDQYDSYFNDQSPLLVRAGMKIVRPWLQWWDVHSNDGVYAFFANSHYVADRIFRCYHRTAEVIYPPVDFDRFSASSQDAGFYLMVTAFVPYKRVDLAIEAFNRLALPLQIIGSGPEEAALKRLAGPTISFLDNQSDDEVKAAYESCRALVFPGEEDFGIVPLEAMASGKPVIAFGKGGTLETVVENSSGHEKGTGVFFFEQTINALVEAVLHFEKERNQFDPVAIRAHVEPFHRDRFREKIGQAIETKYQTFCKEKIA
jgi:glycosyltransferase involved in cell wall biosynthesis